MAGSEVVEVVLSVEEQPGKPADGSDHTRSGLDDLKSKFYLLENEETPPSSSISSSALDDLKSEFDLLENEETPPRSGLDDLKFKFYLLENEETPPSSSSSNLQCPRVPNRLRSDVKGAENYYAPKLISLGPYHHGESHLAHGETLKLKLAKAYIQECNRVNEFYCKIHDRINELKACYAEESTKKYEDDKFAAMMLVDGCALLCYILCVCLGWDHEVFNIRYQDMILLHQDALLLENQLPYQLLQTLMYIVVPESEFANVFWKAIFKEFFGMNDKSFFQEFFGDEESFQQKKKNYCCSLFLPNNQITESKPKTTDNESNACHHLLDLFRRNLLGDERSSSPTHTEKENSSSVGRKLGRASVIDVMKFMLSFRNVKELMAAGIRIKRSPTRQLRDISFRSNGITACLRLPPITIDNSTKAMFLNLIAYEISSDVPHDFISYLRFLDFLIDHADDVKELQSIGILQNNLGTHEEVAEFFNTVSAKLESNFHAYKDVRDKIWKHLQSNYNSKMKMWITECLDTYFGSPSTNIAWIGAALALFFTAVQTYFSVFHH